MIQTQPFDFADFRGGVTDYYLDAPIVKCQRCDNLLIVPHGTTAKLVTRAGSDFWLSADPQIPPGAQRIGMMRYFGKVMFAQSSKQIYHDASGLWTTLTGPTANPALHSGVNTTSVISHAADGYHVLISSDGVVGSKWGLPSKIFIDGTNTPQVRTAGLPRLASAPTITPSAPAGVLYLYAFLYKQTYTVANQPFVTTTTRVFQDFGPVRTVQVTGNAIGAVNHSITVIPVLANTADTNYDTSTTTKVEIYRTIANGVDFYKVGEVNNGTTTFADTVQDTTLVNQQLLYTTGGVVENDPPPPTRLVHVVESVAYYADGYEGTDRFSNRIWQSIEGDIDAVPATFYVDVDTSIVGLSSVRGTPVAVCDVGAYRVDGRFDELGRGGMVAQKISDTCSCVSSQSVVQTFDGVFWCGRDAFYYTDGYRVMKVNEDLDKTHQLFLLTEAQRQRVQGKYDPVHRRVYWSVQVSTIGDCDTIFVLDLNWGLTPNSPFTTLSGGDAFAPTAIEFVDGNLVRADTRGFIFGHDDALYTDPAVDILALPADWTAQTIRYDYISAATNFGTNFVRKWTTWVNVQCRNETNLSLQVSSIDDDGKREGLMKEIRYRGNLTWGQVGVLWGDDAIVWNDSGLIEEQRRFPKHSLRSSYKQIRLTNAYTNIVNSNYLGTVTVDAGLKTVTLDDSATKDWLDDLVGYVICFETDNYVQAYPILDVSSDVVTYEDPSNLSMSASGVKFQVKGYPKGEIMSLLGFTVHFAAFGTTQNVYNKSESGAVS